MLAVLQDVTREKEAELALRDGAPAGSAAAARARDILRRLTDHLARLVDDLLDRRRPPPGRSRS